MTQQEILAAIQKLTEKEDLSKATTDDYKKLSACDWAFDSDDCNPAFLFPNVPVSLLCLIAKGAIDLQALAKLELEYMDINLEGEYMRSKTKK